MSGTIQCACPRARRPPRKPPSNRPCRDDPACPRAVGRALCVTDGHRGAAWTRHACVAAAGRVLSTSVVDDTGSELPPCLSPGAAPIGVGDIACRVSKGAETWLSPGTRLALPSPQRGPCSPVPGGSREGPRPFSAPRLPLTLPGGRAGEAGHGCWRNVPRRLATKQGRWRWPSMSPRCPEPAARSAGPPAAPLPPAGAPPGCRPCEAAHRPPSGLNLGSGGGELGLTCRVPHVRGSGERSPEVDTDPERRDLLHVAGAQQSLLPAPRSAPEAGMRGAVGVGLSPLGEQTPSLSCS